MMMLKVEWLFSVSVAMVLLVGCGVEPHGGNNTITQTRNERESTTVSATHPPAEITPTNPAIAASTATFDSPQEVVEGFLRAMRDGDQATIRALMTRKAREETEKSDQLEIQPPGSPNSSYQVGRMQFADDSKTVAHVSSVWTEPGADGRSIQYEVVWILRREDTSWRIAGMATQISENAPPLFLNFEDPADMLAKLEEAQKASGELESESPVTQAGNPSRTGSQTMNR
jgi:hypothetical protein